MYSKLFISLFIFFTVYHTSAVLPDGFAPSPLLLNRAYCACKCCDEKPEQCHMHEAIKNLECSKELCTPAFCTQWKTAQCHTSCFCQKCKDELIERQKFKCATHNGVPEHCECSDPDTIECPKPDDEPEELDDNPDIAQARKAVNQYKENSHCIVPCFCRKCKDSIPRDYVEECQKADKPADNCTCKDTTCPTQQELSKLKEIVSEANMMTDEENREAYKDYAKRIQAETNELNERLKPAIEAGNAKPVNVAEFRKTKCKIQCLCDKCRADSPMMDKNCKNIIKDPEQFCPPCPDDLTCPDENEDAACKMFCFCDVCKYDKRMPQMLLNKCEEVAQLDVSSCDCTGEDVNCNALNQLDAAQKAAMDRKVRQDKKKAAQEEKKNKKGKIKKKNKMWDEL